jgi:orotate phosphoribosyltransferase
MSEYFLRLRQLVMDPAVLQHLPAPVELASGEMSQDFVDAKLAVDDPDDLDLVGAAMTAAAAAAGVSFEAVGGLALGAVPFTFAVAHAARCRWFLVRKEPKGRGTNRWAEGARLQPGTPVMLVDDVITTGGSIQVAYDKVTSLGARVVFATTLVDRGDVAAGFFQRVGVPYVPMLTYRDLGIAPVGAPG